MSKLWRCAYGEPYDVGSRGEHRGKGLDVRFVAQFPEAVGQIDGLECEKARLQSRLLDLDRRYGWEG